MTVLTDHTEWAGGETDYSQGPFTMYMKSMKVTDYSTGNSYSYSDQTGSWDSITSDGGKVNGNSAEEPSTVQSAPTVTATVSDIPVPWSGTHKETSSWVTPDVWPWVATDSPTAGATSFPSGWESGSGQIQPPSGSSLGEHLPAPAKSQSAKTKTVPNLQFISRFTSAASASSLDLFFPSGYDTAAWKNGTHHPKITRTWHRPTAAKTHTHATATTMSHIASSSSIGVSLTATPIVYVILGAFLGGTLGLF